MRQFLQFTVSLLAVAAMHAAPPLDRRLVDAVRDGRTRQALALLDAGADIRQADSRGYTPLLWAAALGDQTTVRALLKKRAGVSFRAPDGEAPLSVAIANGHARVVEMLLAAGAEFDNETPRLARSREMEALLRRAAALGDSLIAAIEADRPADVSKLMDAGAPSGFVADRYKAANTGRYHALDVAARSKNTRCVRRLLAAGARISDQTEYSRFHGVRQAHDELQTALGLRNFDAVRVLLESKPSCHVVRAALSLASRLRKEEPDAVDAVFAPVLERNRALLSAVRRSDEAAVRRLLSEGADPGRLDPSWPSPVAIAAQNGRAGILRLLLIDGWNDAPLVNAGNVTAEVAGVLKPYLPAQAPSLEQALTSLMASAEKLPPGRERDRIQASGRWLLRRVNQASGVSEEYRVSLVRLAESLAAIAGRSALAGGGREEAPLADIAEELETKRDHCEKLNLGMGGTVKLRVTTLRDARHVVGGWQVFYLLKIYEHAKDRSPEMAPGWTSPAVANLEPGRYFIWARDPASGRNTERLLLRLSGSPSIEQPILVP